MLAAPKRASLSHARQSRVFSPPLRSNLVDSSRVARCLSLFFHRLRLDFPNDFYAPPSISLSFFSVALQPRKRTDQTLRKGHDTRERDRGTKRTAVSVTERREKETPKDRSYVQSEACRCPSFVRRSARLSVPQSKPRRVGARTSEGYERTPVFLGSTCFVLRPCGTARLRLNWPNANFFFRRTAERDGNPYFLSATFLPGLRYNR